MNALGKGRMSSAQRENLDAYVKREVQRQYDKEIDNAENFGKFFTTVVACDVLESVFHFGAKRRRQFLDEFVKKSNELSEYINSNTCIEGEDGEPIFDKDFNIEVMNRYASRFDLKFDEGIIEY